MKPRRRNLSEARVAAATLAGLTVMGLAGYVAYKYKLPGVALGGLFAAAAAMGVSFEVAQAGA